MNVNDGEVLNSNYVNRLKKRGFIVNKFPISFKNLVVNNITLKTINWFSHREFLWEQSQGESYVVSR